MSLPHYLLCVGKWITEINRKVREDSSKLQGQHTATTPLPPISEPKLEDPFPREILSKVTVI